MLQTTINKGHIKGVLIELIPRGISHIQYANDTILFVEYDDACITNTKFLLYCLSG